MESPSMSTDSSDFDKWHEIREFLDLEVNCLPDKLRVPFVLFHLENYSLAEVAAIVDSNVSTVGTWLQRSRELLADRLRRRGIVMGAAVLGALLTQHLTTEPASAAFVAGTIQAASVFTPASASGSSAMAAHVKTYLKHSALKKKWVITGLVTAVLVALPVTLFWFVPVLQTRFSANFSQLQGEWREIQEMPKDDPLNARPHVEYVGSLMISGRQFKRYQTLASGQVLGVERGAFVLNDTRRPRTIDFSLWMGIVYGIYEIDGDTLTLCVTVNSGERPNSFSKDKLDENQRLTRYQKVR